MEDVHSATPALPLGTLFLIIWRTVLFLCLSSETSLNIFFSHRTSTPSAFEVITEMRYINYLLTYLHLLLLSPKADTHFTITRRTEHRPGWLVTYQNGLTVCRQSSTHQSSTKSSYRLWWIKVVTGPSIEQLHWHRPAVQHIMTMSMWLGSLGLMIARSQVRLPATPLPRNNPGQVVHTRQQTV